MKNKKQYFALILIIVVLAISLMAFTFVEKYESGRVEETPTQTTSSESEYYLLPMVAPAGRQVTG